MLGSYLFIAFITISILGALGAAALNGRHLASRTLAFGSAAIASLFGMACALDVILGGSFTLSLFSTRFGTFSFYVDGLSAFFVLMISLLSLVVSIYSFGYVKQYEGEYSIGLMGFLYNMFILSMALVVTARNAVLFLILWEAMSLLSYALVVYENRNKDAVKSGFIYIVMTHAGTAFIMLSFLLLANFTGSFDFGSFVGAGAAMPYAAEERRLPDASHRVRHEGRHHPVARLAAVRASGGAEQHLRAHVRRDGENGHLHADKVLLRFSGRHGHLVGPAGICSWPPYPPSWASCTRSWRRTSSVCWPTPRWRTSASS